MEKESIEPLKITLTGKLGNALIMHLSHILVVSARKLKCKRKGGKCERLRCKHKDKLSVEICQSSVVFGMGKELFQTEVIESNEPFWNQEAHMY